AQLGMREGANGERDGEIGLAGPGRTDRKRDRMLSDRVDVALLVDRLRRDLLTAVTPDHVVEDLANVRGLIEGAEDGIHRARTDLVTALDELDELVDDGARLR